MILRDLDLLLEAAAVTRSGISRFGSERERWSGRVDSKPASDQEQLSLV